MDKASHKGYSCRLLEEKDWHAYKQIRLLQSFENNFPERLTEESAQDDAYWKKLITGDTRFFGLFRGKEIIGYTTASLAPEDRSIKFNGSYISTPYRGRGLADLLYEARLQYTNSVQGFDYAFCQIWEGNTRSRHAAERNGFVNTGVYLDPDNRGEGNRSIIYRRDLQPSAAASPSPARAPRVS